MSRRQKRRIHNKKKSPNLLRERVFVTICISIFLGVVLVTTNILLSQETYKIIKVKAKIDELHAERVDLQESIDNLLSPTRIRRVAIDKFKMENVDDISELVDLQP